MNLGISNCLPTRYLHGLISNLSYPSNSLILLFSLSKLVNYQLLIYLIKLLYRNCHILSFNRILQVGSNTTWRLWWEKSHQYMVNESPLQATGRSRSDLLQHTEERHLSDQEHFFGAGLRPSGVRINSRKGKVGGPSRKKLPVCFGGIN